MDADAGIAVVLKGYPRLSETFIAEEIRALEACGLPLSIVSLRYPTDRDRHPVHGEIRAPVLYLPEYLHREPGRVRRAWRAVRERPGYRAARRQWLRDLARDRTRNRVRRFGQALVLAHELPAGVCHLHAHFLHTPASVARYAALVRGLTWSCSAHAKDIWTSPEWEKRDKLAACDWAVTCTETNRVHLDGLAPPGKVELVYHGLPLHRFPPPRPSRSVRDGSDAGDPVILLSVGRSVEKKGYDVLLQALARLPAGLQWRFEHVGGGPLRERLRRQAERLGIAPRVCWRGPLPQEAVVERYRGADAFVLACRVTADGDRDGLPNVLVEAQSQRLACLSTLVSGVPELIVDGETGLLVPPADEAALAAALERLIREPLLRARLGAAGETRVRTAFGFEAGVARIHERLLRSVRAVSAAQGGRSAGGGRAVA